MTQNRSHAVMAQRAEGRESLDDFPTPPWATRALLEHCIPNLNDLRALHCYEPASGRGYMAEALKEYFARVTATDIFDYGYCPTLDFLSSPMEVESYDWVITNPPFRLAEQFIEKSLYVARHGVAMLTRTVFLESVGRFERLFSKAAPTVVAQFSERVPMVKGRVDQKASTATGYAWLIWIKSVEDSKNGSRLTWVPPCRKALEREIDYIIPAERDNKTHLIKSQLDLFSAQKSS